MQGFEVFVLFVTASSFQGNLARWNVGLMVWDLFEGKHMFTERLPSRDASEPAHLARMISLLGRPPKDILARGQSSNIFLDEEGNFMPDIKIQETSLEDEEENLQGEEKKVFLPFLRKMLQWRPEDRKPAREVMEVHGWCVDGPNYLSFM